MVRGEGLLDDKHLYVRAMTDRYREEETGKKKASLDTREFWIICLGRAEFVIIKN